MSRKTIVAVLVCYFVVALAFGLFTALNKPVEVVDFRYSTFDRRLVETAVLVFVLSGLLPLVFWATDRFRPEKAGKPLVAWGLIGVVFMLISGATAVSERKSDTSHVAASIAGVTGIDHGAFVKTTRTACIADERKAAAAQQRAEREKEKFIVHYCECFADAMDKEVTADEIVFLARNGKPSASFQKKADRIAPICRETAAQ